MISAKIILDSIHAIFGHRITTMLVTFPRYILAEKNTHRVLSKNSASSRAIPYKKMLKSVMTNPFIPIAWQKDHSGMQGTEYLDPHKEYGLEDFIVQLNKMLVELNPEAAFDNELAWTIENILSSTYFGGGQKYTLKEWWLKTRDLVVSCSLMLNAMGVTKQLANRLLEPFMWHTVLVTATEWENFFALRCPQYELAERFGGGLYRSKKDFSVAYLEAKPGDIKHIEDSTIESWLQINRGAADIHIMALAEAMWDALNESTPQTLNTGEWHIPFQDKISIETILNETLLRGNLPITSVLQETMQKESSLVKVKVSTAMCARTSYTVFGEEGKQHDYTKDIELHDRLSTSGHWSPFEHCAQAMNEFQYEVNALTINLDTEDSTTKIVEGVCGNFRGFIQYRKMFANENIT